MSYLIEKLRYKYADYLHLAAADRIEELEASKVTKDQHESLRFDFRNASKIIEDLQAENERLRDALLNIRNIARCSDGVDFYAMLADVALQETDGE